MGALLASVCPGEFALWVRLNLEKDDLGRALAGSFPMAREQLSAVKKPDDFALKLGFGRPLGLGSVVATIDEADTTAIDAAFACLWTKLLLAADGAALDRRLAAWFRSHRYAGSTLLHYPQAEIRRTTTIFNYHSDIRKKHAEGRRNANNDDIASKALPPLELLS